MCTENKQKGQSEGTIIIENLCLGRDVDFSANKIIAIYRIWEILITLLPWRQLRRSFFVPKRSIERLGRVWKLATLPNKGLREKTVNNCKSKHRAYPALGAGCKSKPKLNPSQPSNAARGLFSQNALYNAALLDCYCELTYTPAK